MSPRWGAAQIRRAGPLWIIWCEAVQQANCWHCDKPNSAPSRRVSINAAFRSWAASVLRHARCDFAIRFLETPDLVASGQDGDAVTRESMR